MPSTSAGRPRSKSTRGAKAKKGDHIPRPPNAFILFRSSFIRSQQIPDKVEGNHSNLSKIAGAYWNSLPGEEKREWEAKAAAASERHRQVYPDWRFRPNQYHGQPKARESAAGGSSRRRSTISTAPEAGPSSAVVEEKNSDAVPARSAKGKGKEKESARFAEEDNERWVKIANLLREGKKGPQLTLAVEEWEDTNKRNAASFEMKSPTMDDRTPQSSDASSKASSPDRQSAASNSAAEGSPDLSYAPTPSQSPSNATSADSIPPPSGSLAHHANPSPRGISSVPLTQMFTRSRQHSTSPLDHSHSIADLCPSIHSNLQLAPISTNGPIRHRYGKESVRHSPMAYGFPQQSEWRPEEAVSSYDSPAPPTREPSYWQWNPPPSELSEASPSEKPCAETLPREMGYDTDGTGMAFDSYGKDFDSSGLPSNGSEVTSWVTSSNRHGLMALLDDPLDDPPSHLPGTYTLGDTIDPSPHPTDQRGISSNYYYQPLSPVAPTSNNMSTTSTSFSTLAGWAGDYPFHRDSNLRSQPADTGRLDYDSGSKFSNPGGWYPQEWSAPTSEDHGMGMVLSPGDWDRVDEFDPQGSQ
ncbi:hypothetical protein FA13DRAFT_1326381 [Coprinellus micaceus]|uniref:HMG box domain-containing protein n=1 Tax=Coprinellus micaceus TaxID=71717 RepID=A0A4Y7SRS9_COPMI|nr:hypothetical protein FA13DRAFT_1326381 [Coprinellus micaceus]